MDISTTLISHIVALGRATSAERVVLFGSRARGDNHPRSDIDLAVYGLPAALVTHFRLGLEELPTLLKIDLVPIGPDTNPDLLGEIQKDGVTLYDAKAS